MANGPLDRHPWALWTMAGVFAAAGVLASLFLAGQLQTPEAGAPLPDADAGTVAAPAREADVWRPVPSVAIDGWLPASRWDPAPAFDVRQCVVGVAEIIDMPPGVADIPHITAPRFIEADAADWITPADEVIGISTGRKSSRCYPLALLVWHNIINDTLDGRDIAILYDPVSGASAGFARTVGGQATSFGVSGKAHRGAALIYDERSRGLWHPLTLRRISGPGSQAGERLKPIHVTRTTWACWRQRHRNTLVLSRNTGFGRPYDVNPYAGKQADDAGSGMILAVPDGVDLQGIPPLTRVLGVVCGSEAAAFIPPSRGPDKAVQTRTELGGAQVRITYDPRPARWEFAASGRGDLVQTVCYWHAWKQAYPNGGVVRLQP